MDHSDGDHFYFRPRNSGLAAYSSQRDEELGTLPVRRTGKFTRQIYFYDHIVVLSSF